MTRRIGYVVVVYNQASGRPHIDPFGGEIFDEWVDADEAAAREQADWRDNGRLERVVVAELREHEDSP